MQKLQKLQTTLSLIDSLVVADFKNSNPSFLFNVLSSTLRTLLAIDMSKAHNSLYSSQTLRDQCLIARVALLKPYTKLENSNGM